MSQTSSFLLFLVVLVFSLDVRKVSEVLQEVSFIAVVVVVIGFPVVVRVIVGVVVVESSSLNDFEVAGTQNFVLSNVVLVVQALGGVAVFGVGLNRLLRIWISAVLLLLLLKIAIRGLLRLWLLLVVLIVARLERSLSLSVTYYDKYQKK